MTNGFISVVSFDIQCALPVCGLTSAQLGCTYSKELEEICPHVGSSRESWLVACGDPYMLPYLVCYVPAVSQENCTT